MQFDGSLNFDTKIDTSGITVGLKKISELAKKGQQALEKLTLNGLKTSGEKALEVVSKISTSGLDSLTKSIEGATVGLTALTGSMSALAGKSVEVGTNFEASLSKVIATAGMTKDSLVEITNADGITETVNMYDTLEAKSKELGASTQFSASQVSDAFGYMAMAGWDCNQMLGGIDGILNLAAASGEDLATTSDIVTDALTAFGLKAEDAGHFSDVLAKASSSANTNVSMMGETFKYVAPVAGSLGFNAEDCSVAIGLMANSGIKASQAGTSLRAIMTRLVKPTDDAYVAMQQLGLSVTNSDGSMKSFNEIMLDMRKSFANLSEAEKASYAALLGGQEAMSGLLAVVNASDSDFNKMNDAMYNCDGAAQKMAETVNDNLKGAWTNFKSASEGVQLAIYDKLENPLKNLAKNGTKYLREFNKALNTDGSQGLIDFALSIGDVLVQAMEDNQQLLQNATDMGTEFMKCLMRGIFRNMDSISKNIAQSLKQGLVDGEKIFTDFYTLGFRLVSEIGEGLAENPEMFTDLASDFIRRIISTFTFFSYRLAKSGTVLLKAILKGFSKSSKDVSFIVTDFVEGLVEIFTENIGDFITLGTDIIVALIEGIQKGMKNSNVSTDEVINAIATGLENNKDRLLDSAWTIISALGRGIGENLPSLSQRGLDIVLTLTDFIGEHADEIGNGAVDLITALADTLITEDNLKRIGDTAIKLISNFATGLTSEENMLEISNIANKIVKTVTDTLFNNSSGGSGVNDVLSAGANIGGQLLNGLTTALFNGNGGIFKILDTLVTSVGTYLSENFWSLGTMVMEGFISGATGINFSFEDFGEYMYDTTHSGHYWQDYFSGLGTALKADTTSDNEIKAYFDRGQSGMSYEEYLQSLENAVNQNNQANSETVAFYQNQLNTQNENLGLLSDKFSQFLNKKQTIQVSLYENADAFAEITATGVNLATARNGGY